MPMPTFEDVFDGPVGTCRYNPPTHDVTWPIVLETDWCGRFKNCPTVGPPPPACCAVCAFFSDDDILGQHPTVPA